MEAERLKQILEAALMITESPLSLDRMMGLFEDEQDPPKRDKVKRTLEELEVDYENSGIELKEVASGYRFQARAELAPWMNRLFEERRPTYSRALLETIAIIAYRQPITRGEIENIRGVAVSTGIIRTLLEREWVRVVGHRDVPGKPAVYATTKTFLDYFNLAKIDELPSLAELKDFDDINADLFKDQQVDEGGEGRELPKHADSEGEDGREKPAAATADHENDQDQDVDGTQHIESLEEATSSAENVESTDADAVEAQVEPTINHIDPAMDEQHSDQDDDSLERPEASISGSSN